MLGVRMDWMVVQRGNESVAQEICLLSAVLGGLAVAAPWWGVVTLWQCKTSSGRRKLQSWSELVAALLLAMKLQGCFNEVSTAWQALEFLKYLGCVWVTAITFMKKLMLNWMKESQCKTKLLRLLPFFWSDSEGLAKRRFPSCWEVGTGAETVAPGGTPCWLRAGGLWRIVTTVWQGYVHHVVKWHCSQTVLNCDEFPRCDPGLCPPVRPVSAPREEVALLPGGKESSARVPASLCSSPSALPFTSPDVALASPREQDVAETSNPTRVISLFATFNTDLSPIVLATSGHT